MSSVEAQMKAGIFVASDMHVGSSEGLMPPNYTDLDGALRIQNPGQAYLWDNYLGILDNLAPRAKEVDLIVINGDILDGKQRKSDGIPLTLHRMEDQKRAAVLALEEIKSRFPSAKWHFVEGTPYHELPEEVRAVAKHFNAEVKQTLPLVVGEARIRFHHEVGFSSGVLKSGNLEREIINNLLSVAMHGWSDYHVEVRSHCHYFRYVGMKDHLALVTPCFQLQNAYGRKNSPTKNIPNLGALYLQIDDSRIKGGMCPASFEELLFPHPEPVAEIFVEETTNEEPVNV
jgi:hypothetical protein